MKTEIAAVTAPRKRGADGKLLTADQFLVYTARVSSPSNQLNTETGPKLLAYCLKNAHWSVFEQAFMTIEIETSLAIAMQIIRHRSFSFQMFSQRYAEVGKLGDMLEPVELRAKAQGGNRQGSGGPVSSALQLDFECKAQEAVIFYEYLLAKGVAPESARFILPQCTKTRLYMTGSIRSWIHYLHSRLDEHAQQEHRLVAVAVAPLFAEEFPDTYNACITTEIPAHYVLPVFPGATEDMAKLLRSASLPEVVAPVVRHSARPLVFKTFNELWLYCSKRIVMETPRGLVHETDYLRAQIMVAQLWLIAGTGWIALGADHVVRIVLLGSDAPHGAILLSDDTPTTNLVHDRANNPYFGQDLLTATETSIQKYDRRTQST